MAPERIRSHLAALTLELDDADRAAIAALDRDGRVGPHPDTFDGV